MAIKKCDKARYGCGSGEMSDQLSGLSVLQDMDHPHIVHVYEMLEDDYNFFIVMELI